MSAPEPARSNGLDLLEVAGEVILRPGAGFRALAGMRLLWPALGVFLLSQIPIYLAGLVMGTVPGRSLFSGLAVQVASSLVALVACTGLVHLVAWLLGGQAPFATFLQAAAFASLPGLLVTPFVAVALAAQDAAGLVPMALSVALVWSFILGWIAVRETFQFTLGRALVALVLPGVLLLALALVLLLLADALDPALVP